MAAAAETEFRIAGESDLNILTDMRLAFLSELRFGCRTSTENELRTAAEKYFALHIEDKTYIRFSALYQVKLCAAQGYSFMNCLRPPGALSGPRGIF
jgi:hypothetical protein